MLCRQVSTFSSAWAIAVEEIDPNANLWQWMGKNLLELCIVSFAEMFSAEEIQNIVASHNAFLIVMRRQSVAEERRFQALHAHWTSAAELLGIAVLHQSSVQLRAPNFVRAIVNSRVQQEKVDQIYENWWSGMIIPTFSGFETVRGWNSKVSGGLANHKKRL